MKNESIGNFIFGTDGKGRDDLIVSDRGRRISELSEAKLEKEYLYMNGGNVFNFTIKTIPALVNNTLKDAGLSLEDVDYFVFHQANLYILEHLRKKIGIKKEKFCVSLKNFGNTVSCTIPMALEVAIREGNVRKGDKVMLVGFGTGLSWAANIMCLEGDYLNV